MQKHISTFFEAVIAGVLIGIAGTVFLRVSDTFAGSWLFSLALLTIVVRKFKLYTGVIGYLATQGKNTLPYLLFTGIIWLGNLAGTYLAGRLFRLTRFYASIAQKADTLASQKLADGALSLFILSAFCGLLMYVAVDTFRKEKVHAVSRVVVLTLCVMVFIQCGFEHSIANMYYFSVSAKWSFATLWAVVIMSVGNGVGGMMIPAILKYLTIPEQPEQTKKE